MKKIVISVTCVIICIILLLGSIMIIGTDLPKPKEKTIYVEVVEGENESSYMLKTDADYLFSALNNDGFIKTKESDLGVELLEIGGVKKEDSEHFELFVNGIREAKTIDKVQLQDKSTYKFELTK